MDTQIKTNTDAIVTNATSNTNIQSELDATQAGAGLGTDGAYTADGSTNYLTTVTSLTSADVALDTQIKTNTDAIATNATSNTSIQTELDATQTGAGLGTDGAYTANGSTNYLTTVTSLTSADVALDTQIKTNTDAIVTNAASNTSIQTELDATQTGAGLGTDGAYTANGSTNYLTTVTSLTSADVALDTQIKTNTDAIVTNATSNTNIQSELDATQAGAGLGTDGAYTADGSTNYLTTVTSLTSADVALDTQIKTNTDAIATNATSNTSIQTELDATQTGAGLAANGTYIADSSTNYISTVGSLADADAALDTQININTTSIITNATAIAINTSDANGLQTELDATQTAAGLGTNGTYSANLSTNYIKTSTSLVDATEDLDTQIKTNTDAIATTNTSIQTELDATQTGAGLAANGIYTANTATNYISTSISLVDATEDLDIQIKTNTDAIATNAGAITTNTSNTTGLQTELDATQTGAGLAANGAYTANGSTNYLTTVTSLTSADVALDTQIKTNTDAIVTNATSNTNIQSELDATQAGAGLGTDGAYTADGSTNYLTTVTSLTSADVALDTQIKTNTDAIATNATSNTSIQTELDATQTGAGLGTDGAYTANGSTNYLTTVTSLTSADVALDTQIKTNTDAIVTNATSSTNIQSELDATQTGAGLAANGIYTANSSANYISTVISLTAADTALDTELKLVSDRIGSLSSSSSDASSNIQTELDATQIGAGLGTDGRYTADGSTNYIASAGSLKAADAALDTQIKANTDAILSISVSDATTTNKGIIKLAGDLGGTSDLPTVPGLIYKEDATNKSTAIALGTSNVLYPTQNAVKTYVDNQIASGSVADATTSSKGILKLAGDLGGTANLPTVPSLGLKENLSHKSSNIALGISDILYPTQKAVKTYVDAQVTVFDATTSLKGIIKLAGDLGGTSELPTVPGLSTKEDTTNKSTSTTLGTSDVLYPTQNAVKTYVDNEISTGSVADATTTIKGVIKLAGDLSGTADAPTVPNLIFKENASLKSTDVNLGSSNVLYPTQNAVKTYIDSQISSLSSSVDASTTVKGILKLTGDLGGTADSPTVPGLSSKEASSNKSTNTVLGTSNDLFPTQNAVKTYVDTQISSSLSLDATSTVKGILKLTGDLSGTSDTPTVPGLLLKAPINNPNLTGLPTAPTAASGANTTQIATTAFVMDAVTGVSASGVFVDLTSDQTVAGKKTFTSDLVISAMLTAGGTALPSSTGTVGQVLMISSSGVAQWTTIIQEINVEVAATASQTSFTISQALIIEVWLKCISMVFVLAIWLII
ncbi:hypothetical protein BST83_01595 [Polaribacter filamentus]|uniref:Uncharacterized protein n=1 Tax=Polaribacter filamentus TaxID=53483 RepID=A0A2S7L2A8_9FLAO|nr:hypothetical protein [Polaribacter filamentus]PQB09062.1 hypothetical protein BST83_01595 [Polaribacter filamentus]